MTTPLQLPVTVLTGFLGSGKTTLINHLLENYPGERIAIIENEFGAVGVDGGLLGQHSGIEVIELTNGCVCCSVRGELTEALKNLLEQRDAGQLNFDRLLLETTGLADPAPVIQTFFVDDILRERLQLDAIITLVDSEHAQKQLTEHRVAVSQVGFADRLILTKLDRIDSDAKTLLLERLRNINAKTLVCEAQHGKLEKAAWIGIQAFNMDDSFDLNGTFVASTAPSQAPTNFRPLNQTSKPLVRSWNDDITSQVFETGEVDIKLIGAFMETAIEKYGNDMLRYKGILAIEGEPRRLIVQGVHKVVGFDYGTEWTAEESRKTLLVIIGRNLPVETLRNEFLATAVSNAVS